MDTPANLPSHATKSNALVIIGIYRVSGVPDFDCFEYIDFHSVQGLRRCSNLMLQPQRTNQCTFISLNGEVCVLAESLTFRVVCVCFGLFFSS